MARQSGRKDGKPARRSWWTDLERQAEEAHLRGHRQWALLRYLARQGQTANRTRNIMRGRRQLAELLGLDIGKKANDDADVVHDLDGRNTRRRLQRFHELGLVHVEQPVCLKEGEIVKARGGRKPGCRSGRLRGRALRIYPGSRVYPLVLRKKQVELDNLADAGLIEWALLSKPADLLSPGEELSIKELARVALRARGP